MSIPTDRKHTKAKPCPICGGWDNQQRGKGVRCAGWMGDNDKWAFCTRVPDGARRQCVNTVVPTWAHLMYDEPLSAPEIKFSDAQPEERIVATYDYLNELGELSYQVVRYEPKRFKQRRPNGSPGSWIWNMQGVRRTMFRAPEVAKSDGVVFLCEGEKDALALAALGLCSTTSSGGADGYRLSAQEGKDLLRGRDVCIIQHQDEAGRKYADGWVGILSGVAKAVRVVDVAEGGDAADWVERGATAGSFLGLWSAAEPTKPRAAIEWVDLHAMAKPRPPVSWICESLKLASGPVSCLAGYGYSGKTALAQALLLCLATGKDLFGLFKCQQMPVGWMDYEQGDRMSAERMQRQARGMGIVLSDYPANSLRYAEYPDVYLTEKGDGVDKVAKAVDGMGLCLLDSARALTPGIDENDSKIRHPFDALSRVTSKTGCAFLVIHHYGKADPKNTKPLKERMRGSSALFDAMQVVWGLDRHEKDDYTTCSISKDRITNVRNLVFGVKFNDDEANNSVRLEHLSPEQMERPTKATLFLAHVLEVVKAFPGLVDKEEIRFRMPEGFRNMTEVRSAVKELIRINQLQTVNGVYRAV